MVSRTHRLILAVAVLLAIAPWRSAATPMDDLPGVRGSLYESPSHGWILIADEPPWRIADAASNGVRDMVRLIADAGDGADDVFISYLDDGRGTEGCVGDLIDSLAAAYEGYPLQGWDEPEPSVSPFADDGETWVYARVVRSQEPGQDIRAVLHCTEHPESALIIGTMRLQSERDFEEGLGLPLLAPVWPGNGHTGQPRDPVEQQSGPGEGVVRFLFTGWTESKGGYAFPFSCINQESFTPPSDPPPGTGYFACDGRIANVDIVPATVDLTTIVLGCERVPAGDDLPPGCTGELVAPDAFELLQPPVTVNGPIVTLAPGEFAEVVLWYALPEGDVPFDIYYLDPLQHAPVLVGPTSFTAGTGSRPKVRLGR